jgi:hypothetical protein
MVFQSARKAVGAQRVKAYLSSAFVVHKNRERLVSAIHIVQSA